MIKEVEIRKINGITQYVDWETGEELYKQSDCITYKQIEDKINDLKKSLNKSFESIDIISKLDFYLSLIKEFKSAR